MMMILTRLFFIGLLLLPLTACNQALIGNAAGQITQGDTTANVNINFTELTFPTGENNTLVIELSNLSGHTATFVIVAKDSAATTLAGKFPKSTYTIGEGGQAAFSGSLPVQGSTLSDLTAIGGFIKILSLTFGKDEAGNDAVAIIGAEFSVDFENNGYLVGSFEKDFT